MPRDAIAKGLLVWCAEFSSAVLMILSNKALMTGALNFRYPTTLTAAHFAWTAAGTGLVNACARGGDGGGGKPVELPPWYATAAFVVLSAAAIILSNASLLLNSVAFYQIMKLATLPFVAIVEWSAGTKRFCWWHPLFYAAILGGVGLTIVGDVSTTVFGTVIACVSFVSAGLHQFYCGRLLANYGLSPSKLLAIVSPFKAGLLFVIGPLIDGAWFGGWIGAYHWTVNAACLVLFTCALAIVLNIAQYSAINLLGAGTYQALSQLKTAAVVVLGSLYFLGTVDPRQLAGTALTVSAVGFLTNCERRQRAAEAGEAEAAAGAPGKDGGGADAGKDGGGGGAAEAAAAAKGKDADGTAEEKARLIPALVESLVPTGEPKEKA